MSNSIGSAALILTTDATQLHKGLNQEGQKIGQWAKKQEKQTAASADKAGMSWTTFAKGAAVAVVAAGAAAYAGLEKIGSLVESFKAGNKSGIDPVDAGKLMVADQSIKNLGKSFDRFAAKGLAALSPFIDLVSQKLQQAMKALEPVVDWLGRAFATHWSIMVDIISEVVELVWDTVKAVGSWVMELFGLQDSTTTVEEVVTGAWKAIAKGAAYVWDSIKAGAGAFAYVASFIVDGLSKIVDAFKEAIKELFNLAGQLPDSMGGQWFRDQAGNVDKWGGKLKSTATDMRSWAKGTWSSFGDSAKDVDKWFEKRKANFKATVVELDPIKYTAVGAAQKGTKEAYSVEARFRTESLVNPQLDVARRQLAEQQKTTQAIKDNTDATKGAKITFMEW